MGTTAQHRAVAIHLATATSYALPFASARGAPVGAEKSQLPARSPRGVSTTTATLVEPPTDPQALREWLATVTNAQASNSEGVTWP
jgi:hypothetical protein